MNKFHIAIIAVGVILLNIFTLNTAFGIGSALFLAFLSFAVATISERKFESNAKKLSTYLLASVSSLLILSTALTANHYISSLYQWFYFGTLYLIILLNGFSFHEPNILWWVVNAAKALPSFFLVKFQKIKSDKLGKIEVDQKTGGGRPNVTKAVGTFFFSLIVLYIFGSLLSSADPLFNKMLNDLLETFFDRLIASAVLGAFLSMVVVFRYRPSTSDYPLKKRISSITTLTTIAGLVLLLSLIHISEPTRPY